MSAHSQSMPAPALPAASGGGRVILLSALSMIGMLGVNLYLPSLPSLAAGLQASAGLVQATLSVFIAGFAGGQLLVGPLSDRFGRRPVLLIGLLVFALASAGAAFVPNIETLLVLRAVQGVAASVGAVVVRAVIRDSYEGPALARTFAIVTTLMAIAPGFSPLLGGGIEVLAGWRANFAVLALLAGILLVLTASQLAESLHRRSARFDLAHVSAEYRRIAGDPSFAGFALITAAALGGLFSFFAASPGIFIGRLGYSAPQFGLIPAISVFAVFAGGVAAAKLGSRWGERPALGFALLALAIGGGGLLLSHLSFGETAASLLIPFPVYLFGMGMAVPLATAAALRPQASRAGTASAWLGFLQMLAGALGSVVVGAFATPLLLPLLMAGFALAAGAIGWRTLRRAAASA